MRITAIENVRGLDGRGLVITVVFNDFVWPKRREAFKTDGSATHWCWIEDGSPCPYEVSNAWQAHMVKNLLAGKKAYTASFDHMVRS